MQGGTAQFWVVLADTGWRFLVLGGAGWCWMGLADTGRCRVVHGNVWCCSPIKGGIAQFWLELGGAG